MKELARLALQDRLRRVENKQPVLFVDRSVAPKHSLKGEKAVSVLEALLNDA